jgi:HYR domain-containing protein
MPLWTDCSARIHAFRVLFTDWQHSTNFPDDGEKCIDNTPPTITVPKSPLLVEATGPSGATNVRYPVTAVDEVDGPITPVCNPPSGSTLPFGDTTVSCTATDKSGNSATAQFVVRVQDTTPPETAITGVVDGNNAALPLTGAQTVSNKVAISFTGTDLVGVAGFRCSMDGQPPSNCSNATPTVISNLSPGTHTFQVQAIDKSGNVDPTPATFSWVVLTPAQAIQQLLLLSKSMNLNPAVQAMITGLLNSAAGILSDNNPTNDIAACNMLNTLVIQLNIRAKLNQISPSQASQLIQSSPYSLQAIEKAQGCI